MIRRRDCWLDFIELGITQLTYGSLYLSIPAFTWEAAGRKEFVSSYALVKRLEYGIEHRPKGVVVQCIEVIVRGQWARGRAHQISNVTSMITHCEMQSYTKIVIV